MQTTCKQIAKETASTALWVFYLNPIAAVVSSLLWVSIIAAVILWAPVPIAVALTLNGAAWFASYRMARSDTEWSQP